MTRDPRTIEEERARERYADLDSEVAWIRAGAAHLEQEQAEARAAEEDIARAERLDALLPRLVNDQRMTKLWESHYMAERAVALGLLQELGRDTWAAKDGSIAVRVTAGSLDYKTAYEALADSISQLILHWSKYAIDEMATALAAALEQATPQRGAASRPSLVVRPARELPPPIEQARREGALEVLQRLDELDVEGRSRVLIDQLIDRVADELIGGWPEEEEA